MNNQVEKWVNEWAISSGDNVYRDINAQINFFSNELFHDYQPAQSLASSFKSRLENWLSNITNEDDRKTLFKILPHIFYVGNKEFNNLFRVAYNEILAKWLIDTDNIEFDDLLEAKRQIGNSLRECWICPITDFDISSFFHINNIPSTPWNEWRPLWEKAAVNRDYWQGLLNHLNHYKVKKLVLVEDFVGSGSQSGGMVDFVLSQGLDLDVLLLPLINCPVGNRLFADMAAHYDRLAYNAVLKPSNNCFITRVTKPDEPAGFAQIRDLIERCYLEVSGGVPPSHLKPYSPYGFRETGGLIVMYTNTPDNTIPSLHWNSDTWDPIFPRHSRN